MRIGDCSSEDDAAQSVIGFVLGRNVTEELNKGKLFGTVVWGDEEKLCKAENIGESGNPNKGA